MPAAASDIASQNSRQLLKAAQAAYDKGNIPTAASLSNLAIMKIRADISCFPPGDFSGVENDIGYQQEQLSDKLKIATLSDPAIIERMVADAEAWAPTDADADGYDPGWKSASRCPDYPGMVKQVKAQMLPMMQTGATLLKIPAYRQAFQTYSDVMQDYDQPPPDDAYSPARVASLGEAIRTMRAIEATQGLPYFGQMAAMDKSTPVAFHLLASGQAAAPIPYHDSPATSLATGMHIVPDAASLESLWHAIYGDASSAPAVPAVDFSRQIVVSVMHDGIIAPASHMFISRVETGAKSYPPLAVYTRTPIWPEGCITQHAIVYPYEVVAMDRPATLPAYASGDQQNFPAPVCPVK
jgi:hypothetical protein